MHRLDFYGLTGLVLDDHGVVALRGLMAKAAAGALAARLIGAGELGAEEPL